MEASALHAPKAAPRTLPAALLRLRSDEQLVALFRAGSEEAFAVLHDRYRQRLFGYLRQMLSGGSRSDAEDVLQDVFVRAYGALRADDRQVNARAWLYRVAHNRCVDHLRRPVPPPADVLDVSRGPALQDPMESTQRREDLRRLVADVGQLPEQQRSALLMREIDGLAYADIALALDVSVPAVKSLLVRARGGIAESMVARDTDCEVIRADLVEAYERGVKASARARRHLRECAGCREYKAALRSMRKSFAALSPALGFAPLALAAKALGLGGAGASGAGAAGAGITAAGACKVAAVVCAGALATGGAVEATHLVAPQDDRPPRERVAAAPDRPAPAPALAAVTASPPTGHPRVERAAVAPAAAGPTAAQRRAKRRQAAAERAAAAAPVEGISAPTDVPVLPAPTATAEPSDAVLAGGSEAPEDAPPVVRAPTGAAQPTTTQPPAATPTPPPATAPSGTAPADVPTPTATPAGPAPEH